VQPVAAAAIAPSTTPGAIERNSSLVYVAAPLSRAAQSPSRRP
jgi:hypothetical protein